MKVKAIIFEKDRNNSVVYLNKKNRSGDTFRHDDCMYLVDKNHFQITKERKYGIGPLSYTKEYITYYYVKGAPKPVPLDEIKEQAPLEVGVTEVSANGHKQLLATMPLPVPDFRGIKNMGIPPAELEQIFNPYFLRIISAPDKSLVKDLQFWLLLATLGITVVLWWKFNGLVTDLEEMRALLEGVSSQQSTTTTQLARLDGGVVRYGE